MTSRAVRRFWWWGPISGRMGGFTFWSGGWLGFWGFKPASGGLILGRMGFTNGTTLLTTRLARHDNLEGLGVWRDAEGFIRLTMISDDNQNAFQRTEITEYRVIEGVDPAAATQ